MLHTMQRVFARLSNIFACRRVPVHRNLNVYLHQISTRRYHHSLTLSLHPSTLARYPQLLVISKLLNSYTHTYPQTTTNHVH